MINNIIITGGSGGIGGAVAKRFLKYGWRVHLLLRSLDKKEIQEMMILPDAFVYKSDPEDIEITKVTIQSIKNDGNSIDFVFHSAGTFLWDDGYPKEAKSFEEVRKILVNSNVKTKESVVSAIESVYQDSLGDIEQGFIGSHAANFAPDGPERTGKYSEEAYVEAMALVQSIAKELRNSRKYKNIFLYEPGLVNTGLSEAFTEERLGSKVDPKNVISAQNYAEDIFPEEFFSSRQ